MRNPDSIKAKLRQLADQEGKPFDYLLMHYFIERLLYRLSVSQYAENFVLKGGLLLYTLLEKDARATKDIDFLARWMPNAPEEMVSVFQKVCSIETDDAIRFDAASITAERIKEDADYNGVRVKLTGYLDKSRHVLQFDIGFGDVVVPKPLPMDYPSLLDMERPQIQVYSRESVIAEKFEAMIALAEANSRMKDFYDIYALSQMFDFEGLVLYEAISQTLQRRGTPLPNIPMIFSEEFQKLRDKQIQWETFKKRIKVADGIDFAEAIAGIRVFLQPVYEAILHESEWMKKWSHQKMRWLP